MSDDFNDGQDYGSSLSTPPRVSYVNEAGIPEEVAESVVRSQDVASAIESWMKKTNIPRGRQYDVFQRNKWSGVDHIFAQMGQAAAAVENDDILSTLADTIEGLAFQKMRFEMDDEDQQDIWNQIARDLNMDEFLKKMWRELFKTSQVYVGVWWDRRSYTVRTPAIQEGDIDPETGKPVDNPGKGNRKRKKRFDVIVPSALTVFDPTKVIPVGNLMFGRERFAYHASRDEHDAFESVMSGQAIDETILRLIERKYEPGRGEAGVLGDLGVDADRLWLFKKQTCFRHTLTRADYERFASVRLKSVLEVLDMKQHLRASDRATLIGSTNFIVVIKKGSDKHPARQAEIDNLKEQARVVARMPILVGDHRLQVDIVTPSREHTLDEDRYWALDSRLVFRALQSFSPSALSSGQNSSQVSELSRVVALGMESRRHQMARTLESDLFATAVDLNPSQLDERPKLAFTPKRITLQIDAQFIKAILELRDRGDISRETMLEEVDYDQDVEAMRRMREKMVYDPVFQSQVPHSSPDSNPFADGRSGGRPPGKTETQPRETD